MSSETLRYGGISWIWNPISRLTVGRSITTTFRQQLVYVDWRFCVRCASQSPSRTTLFTTTHTLLTTTTTTSHSLHTVTPVSDLSRGSKGPQLFLRHLEYHEGLYNLLGDSTRLYSDGQGLATPKGQKRSNKHKQVTIGKKKGSAAIKHWGFMAKHRVLHGSLDVRSIQDADTVRYTCRLYTHLIYSFVSVNSDTFEYDFSGLNYFSQFIALNKRFFYEIDGLPRWSRRLDQLAWHLCKARCFRSRDCKKTLRSKGVQGLDIDWEYPSAGADRTGLVAIAKACIKLSLRTPNLLAFHDCFFHSPCRIGL